MCAVLKSSGERSSLELWAGHPYPLGAYCHHEGINFALYAENAERVELLLFKNEQDDSPKVISLPDKTGPVWHGYIKGLKEGQLYGYRVYGPYEPKQGHRFNPSKVLLDPYAKLIGRPLKWTDAVFAYDLNKADDRVASLESNLKTRE